MAQWQATFRDRKSGKTSTMTVEDATQKGARETASIFQTTRGTLVEVKPQG